MGSSPVAEYADMFMDERIDKKIENEARKYNKLGQDALSLLKRFLDDILLIFCGTSKELHKLLEDINKINPTMKFTMNHTTVKGETQANKCDCKQ